MDKLRTLAAAGGLAVAALGAGMLFDAPLAAAEAVVRAPAPALDPPAPAGTVREVAVLAGGCFWGVQGVYSHVRGVESAVSGYAGGVQRTASYEDVSGGDTGHAESVRITFDPRVISYGRILQIYFSVVADPTELNRQGPDSGTQYRSAVFPTSDRQRRIAAAYIAQLGTSRLWQRPIVTRIERASGFFPAEAYHQNYLALNPDAAYIRINDMPKVAALRRLYPALYAAKPVLVRS